MLIAHIRVHEFAAASHVLPRRTLLEFGMKLTLPAIAAALLFPVAATATAHAQTRDTMRVDYPASNARAAPRGPNHTRRSASSATRTTSERTPCRPSSSRRRRVTC
jgi:hypothetical protein